ncbi:MAG: hypothetical protein ACRC0Y_03570, partial [Fusobacteriaceae bacterium]
HIPKPSLTLLFHLDIESVKEVINKRTEAGEEADVYESNLELMGSITNNVARLATLPGFTLVKCNKEDGSRFTVDEIHEQVVTLTNEILNKKGE